MMATQLYFLKKGKEMPSKILSEVDCIYKMDNEVM